MTQTNEELVEEFKKTIGYQTVGTHVLPPLQNSDVVVGALMVALATKDAACEDGKKVLAALRVLSTLGDTVTFEGKTYTLTALTPPLPDQLTDKPHNCQSDMLLTSDPPQHRCSKCGRTEKQPF